jgi:hypothetical protein
MSPGQIIDKGAVPIASPWDWRWLPLLALEDWVLVADRADRLKAQGDTQHCRFRQPGGDDLHTDWKTVVVCSEPHRQGRQAGQAEGRSRSHHMVRRYCLAIERS